MKPITRRAALAGASLAAMLPAPVLAQNRSVKFTLPWLAEGSSIFYYAGRAKGIYAKHGIDLDISRGFGSLAAGQAIGAGQFEFGAVFTAPMILLATKGLPLISIATLDYDAGMGVGVLGDSAITTPAMLAGKKIGDVPNSAEFPFFPAYAQKAGFDAQSVQFVNVDAKVLERLLIEKQVEAMTGVAGSSLPIFISKNVPVRWMLYSSAGLPSYGASLVTTRATLDADPALCAAMVDATCESLAFALQEPEEATALFMKALPEMALNPGAKSFLRTGLGLHDYAVAKPEAKEHGIGYGDPAVVETMTALVMQYLAAPGAARPPLGSFFRQGLGGKVTLTQAEWSAVDARVAEFGHYMA